MNINQWFKDYLAKYTPCKNDWNYVEGCILKAAVDLYQATGDADFKQFALDYMSACVAEDGSIPNCEMRQRSFEAINAGKTLFFALEETGEERYRKAIEFHMQRLRCGDDPKDGKTIYAAGPFWMAYEMKCGGMEKVADVVRLYKCMDNDGQRPDGWTLMALVDAIGWCREELYEHYRALVDIFREKLAGVLLHPADEADAMVSYALLKAVRLGLIDPEKYLLIGKRMLDALQVRLSGQDAPEAVGTFIMAYSEWLRAK